jgi:hypothetical protein
MNRVVFQEGYSLPFDAYRRKRKSGRRRKMPLALKRQQSKMKACALKWRRGGGRGSYRRFMAACLRK